MAIVSVLANAGCSKVASLHDGRESAVNQIRLLDLNNQATNPFPVLGFKAIVFVFVSTECPISNRYAPELRRLYESFEPRGVKFCLVYPDPTESADQIRKHVKEFQYPFDALRDPRQKLVKLTNVRVTPEVAVFISGPAIAYHGRIDNRYVDFGKERPAPTQCDLQEVLEAILSGKPITHPFMPAVGCYISTP